MMRPPGSRYAFPVTNIFKKFTLALNPKVSQILCHRFVSLGNTNVVKSCCTCVGGSRSQVGNDVVKSCCTCVGGFRSRVGNNDVKSCVTCVGGSHSRVGNNDRKSCTCVGGSHSRVPWARGRWPHPREQSHSRDHGRSAPRSPSDHRGAPRTCTTTAWCVTVVYLGWPRAFSYMSPNAKGGGELRGLSQWVQLYTEAQINFGDLTPYLTCGHCLRVLQVEKQVDIYFILIAANVVDPYWFQCGSGSREPNQYGSGSCSDFAFTKIWIFTWKIFIKCRQ